MLQFDVLVEAALRAVGLVTFAFERTLVMPRYLVGRSTMSLPHIIVHVCQTHMVLTGRVTSERARSRVVVLVVQLRLLIPSLNFPVILIPLCRNLSLVHMLQSLHTKLFK